LEKNYLPEMTAILFNRWFLPYKVKTNVKIFFHRLEKNYESIKK